MIDIACITCRFLYTALKVRTSISKGYFQLWVSKIISVIFMTLRLLHWHLKLKKKEINNLKLKKYSKN